VAPLPVILIHMNTAAYSLFSVCFGYSIVRANCLSAEFKGFFLSSVTGSGFFVLPLPIC
jgi:hypothetical protein